MIVGVFDSGVGGKSVVRVIQRAIPDIEIIYKEDKENLPYGTKTPEQLYELVLPILQTMVNEGAGIIVIACNTVTTNIITRLREGIEVPLIGMEPMVKPAAELTETGVIGVFATPATLSSDRYKWLKTEYCDNISIIEPDCSNWASMIEDNHVDRSQIEQNIELCITKNADVIVLGCTHYHWIEELIKEITAGRARVLQPEIPVIKQLQVKLEQLR